MNGRLFAIGLFVFAGLVVDGFLLGNEDISEPDSKSKKEQAREDPLFGMAFTDVERESNLRKMGFEPDEVQNVLKRIATLVEKYRVKDPAQNAIVARFESAEDSDAIDAAFCGANTSTLPVRYAAMPFLVEDRDGQLKAVDVNDISAFKYNDWASKARIQTAYEYGERTNDRKEDATRMVMAAILARQEGKVIDHESPWGGGFIGGGWSWSKVQSSYRGVNERLFDYVALLHVVLETAQAENGPCSST